MIHESGICRLLLCRVHSLTLHKKYIKLYFLTPSIIQKSGGFVIHAVNQVPQIKFASPFTSAVVHSHMFFFVRNYTEFLIE
jgi:hypothetical protein